MDEIKIKGAKMKLSTSELLNLFGIVENDLNKYKAYLYIDSIPNSVSIKMACESCTMALELLHLIDNELKQRFKI